MDGRRFALYFAPEECSALARLGSAWLGREPDRIGVLPASCAQAGWIAEPRGYGFHATLKAPFHLAAGADAAALAAAISSFAQGYRPFTEPPFRLERLDGFLALRPARPSAAIAALAAACVRDFDRFRAPASETERRRRLSAPLSEGQRAMLDRWGYPHVFEEFRFHMTLTRRLDGPETLAALPIVAELAAEALAEPVQFHSVCLFEQAGPGQPFLLSMRFPLQG